MFGLEKIGKAFTNPGELLNSFNPLKMVGDLAKAFSSPEGLMGLAKMAAPFAPPPWNMIAKAGLGMLNGGGDPTKVAGDLLGGQGAFGEFKAEDLATFATKFLGSIK
jgi:hypothetical protein